MIRLPIASMRSPVHFLFVLGCALWLAGCASAPAPVTASLPATTAPTTIRSVPTEAAATPAATSAPVAMPSLSSADALPAAPAPEQAAAAPPLPPASQNRAVLALLDRARQDAGQGRREAAGAGLERALRIEPRNPWLWHELARLRLAQGQYGQAAALAQKSNSLSGQQRSLQALNWRLISDARTAQGDATGATQANQVAEELEQQ
jgi:tetratricopeptide (TPR) repeat protein